MNWRGREEEESFRLAFPAERVRGRLSLSRIGPKEMLEGKGHRRKKKEEEEGKEGNVELEDSPLRLGSADRAWSPSSLDY